MTWRRFEQACIAIGYLIAVISFVLMIWIALDTMINFYLIRSWVNHAIQTQNLKFLYDRISSGPWWMFGRVWVPDGRALHLLAAFIVYSIGTMFVLAASADVFENTKHANLYAIAVIFVVTVSPLVTLIYGMSSDRMIPDYDDNYPNQSITKIANQQVRKYKVNCVDHANEFQRIDGTTFKVNGTTYYVKDKNNIIMNYHHQPMASRQITVEWTQYNHVPKYLKAFNLKDLPSSVNDNNSLKVIIDQ